MHLALAGWYRLVPSARTPTAAGRLLDQAWMHEGFRNDDQSAHWRDRARDMVTRYARTMDPDDEPPGLERTVATRTDVLAVSGRLDRRSIDGTEQLVVVDYESGRRLLTAYDARSSLALALYALAVTRTFHRPCLRVELHHLPTGDVVARPHSRDPAASPGAGRVGRCRSRRRREHLQGREPDSDVVDVRFPAQVSSACRWCDFLRVCPEGAAAHSPAEPWAALGSAD